MLFRVLIFLLFAMRATHVMGLGGSDHYQYFERIDLIDGGQLTIARSEIIKRQYGHPHLIHWGGGPAKVTISFLDNQNEYYWEDFKSPILLQKESTTYYLVALGERPDGAWGFNFFKLLPDKKIISMQYQEFPKNLAKRNMWFDASGIHYPRADVVDRWLKARTDNNQVFIWRDHQNPEEMNPTSYWFPTTLDLRLWLTLEKGLPYTSQNDELSKPFAQEENFKDFFIKKYLPADICSDLENTNCPIF